jgi:putative transposase
MSSVPKNATVLLIGASRGSGYAIAEEYLDRGSQVVATVRGPGRTLKLLNVVDEFTREALAVVVERSIDADRVVATLEMLGTQRGVPRFVRFDNGPEFIARAVADWCPSSGPQSIFIDPGSPWQHAWTRSFNGRLRDKLLNVWQFDTLLEAQVLIEDWRIDYNDNRPPQRSWRSHPE